MLLKLYISGDPRTEDPHFKTGYGSEGSILYPFTAKELRGKEYAPITSVLRGIILWFIIKVLAL